MSTKVELLRNSIIPFETIIHSGREVQLPESEEDKAAYRDIGQVFDLDDVDPEEAKTFWRLAPERNIYQFETDTEKDPKRVGAFLYKKGEIKTGFVTTSTDRIEDIIQAIEENVTDQPLFRSPQRYLTSHNTPLALVLECVAGGAVAVPTLLIDAAREFVGNGVMRVANYGSQGLAGLLAAGAVGLTAAYIVTRAVGQRMDGKRETAIDKATALPSDIMFGKEIIPYVQGSMEERELNNTMLRGYEAYTSFSKDITREHYAKGFRAMEAASTPKSQAAMDDAVDLPIDWPRMVGSYAFAQGYEIRPEILGLNRG